MSYMGMQILYNIINHEESLLCERVFAPAVDMEQLMREKQVPLFSLESKTPVREFDVLGFTLQYEMSFTNMLNMLDLGNIPLHADARTEEDPLIIAGGPCMSISFCCGDFPSGVFGSSIAMSAFGSKSAFTSEPS